MKYLLFLLLIGCTTPIQEPVIVTPPQVEEPVTNNEFIVETDIRMCIENPESPWCVIECERYVHEWCK